MLSNETINEILRLYHAERWSMRKGNYWVLHIMGHIQFLYTKV